MSFCILWDKVLDKDGYGRGSRRGRSFLAHREAYEEAKGPIPDGLELDHLCRNRACINPEHLEPVTHAENIRRGRSYNASKTRCVNGHAFDEANTWTSTEGRRRCRRCNRERARARVKARLS